MIWHGKINVNFRASSCDLNTLNINHLLQAGILLKSNYSMLGNGLDQWMAYTYNEVVYLFNCSICTICSPGYYLDEWPVCALSQVDACTWTNDLVKWTTCAYVSGKVHLDKWNSYTLDQIVALTAIAYLTKWSVDEGTWPGDCQSLVQVQGSIWLSASNGHSSK